MEKKNVKYIFIYIYIYYIYTYIYTHICTPIEKVLKKYAVNALEEDHTMWYICFT